MRHDSPMIYSHVVPFHCNNQTQRNSGQLKALLSFYSFASSCVCSYRPVGYLRSSGVRVSKHGSRSEKNVVVTRYIL